MKPNTSANHQHKILEHHNQFTGVVFTLHEVRCGSQPMRALENVKTGLIVLWCKIFYDSECVLLRL